MQMRSIQQDKKIKKSDAYKQAQKVVARAENLSRDSYYMGGYYVETYDYGKGLVREVMANEKAVNKAYRDMEKVYNKYGDKAFIKGSARANKKINKQIEATNKVLMEIEGVRISDFKKTVGEKNTSITVEKVGNKHATRTYDSPESLRDANKPYNKEKNKLENVSTKGVTVTNKNKTKGVTVTKNNDSNSVRDNIEKMKRPNPDFNPHKSKQPDYLPKKKKERHNLLKTADPG